MSAKLKNASKVQVLVLSHIEKVVMLGIVALAGWLVYASAGRESEEREPDRLAQLVERTRTTVNEYTWENALELADPAPPLAEEFEAQANGAISPETYAISRYGLDRGLVPQTVLRKDPTLLAALAPEANGYTTLMAFYDSAAEKKNILEQRRLEAQKEKDREKARAKPEDDARGSQGGAGRGDLYGPGTDGELVPTNAGGRRVGISVDDAMRVVVQPCAVVTAKVPVEEQFKQYQEVLENALGYDITKDIPRYLGYVVQRAEVRGDNPLEFKPLKFRNGLTRRPLTVVSSKTIERAVADWADEMEEIVDPDYLDESLTVPLPALVGREWGAEVVHSDVPLAAETEAKLAKLDDAPVEDDLDEDDETDFSDEGDDGRRGGARGGGRGAMGPARGGIGGRRGGRGSLGGGGGRRSAMGEGMGRGVGSRGDKDQPFAASHLLLRFIDFDVKQGRRYAYRFQLLMVDVNGKGQTPGRYLDKEVLGRVSKTQVKAGAVPYIRTEWSEPSPVVSIPLAGAVRVAEVQRSSRGEPTAKVVVSSFDLDESRNAIEASLELDKVRLGTVFNRTEKDAWILVDGNRYRKKVDQFVFRTGMTLLDLAGGESLSREMRAPGEALMMDPTGRLVVRSSTKDYEDVEQHRDYYSEDDSRRPGGRGPTDGGGGFDPFGDLGGF